MVRNPIAVEAAAGNLQQQQQAGTYCSSIPPQIVIPRARHNQVNYAVHRGQVSRINSEIKLYSKLVIELVTNDTPPNLTQVYMW